MRTMPPACLDRMATVSASLPGRRLERTADNIAGRLPGMFRLAGFTALEQIAQQTILGMLALYRGRK